MVAQIYLRTHVDEEPRLFKTAFKGEACKVVRSIDATVPFVISVNAAINVFCIRQDKRDSMLSFLRA